MASKLTATERVAQFNDGKVEIKDGVIIFENGETSDLHKELHENLFLYAEFEGIYYNTDMKQWVVSADNNSTMYPIPLIEEAHEDGKKWWEILLPPYREHMIKKGRRNGADMLEPLEIVELTEASPDIQFIVNDNVYLESMRPHEIGVKEPEYLINNTWGDDEEISLLMKEVIYAEIKQDVILVTYFNDDEEDIGLLEITVNKVVLVDPRTREPIEERE